MDSGSPYGIARAAGLESCSFGVSTGESSGKGRFRYNYSGRFGGKGKPQGLDVTKLEDLAYRTRKGPWERPQRFNFPENLSNCDKFHRRQLKLRSPDESQGEGSVEVRGANGTCCISSPLRSSIPGLPASCDTMAETSAFIDSDLSAEHVLLATGMPSALLPTVKVTEVKYPVATSDSGLTRLREGMLLPPYARLDWR